MSTYSSQLISNITRFRNPNGPEEQWTRLDFRQRKSASIFYIALAEVGYIVTVPLAVMETVSAITALFFNRLMCPSSERLEVSKERVKSSSFSIGWALCDAVINPLCNDMIVHEKVARACAASGNIFRVPIEALESGSRV